MQCRKYLWALINKRVFGNKLIIFGCTLINTFFGQIQKDTVRHTLTHFLGNKSIFSCLLINTFFFGQIRKYIFGLTLIIALFEQ